MMDLSQEMEIGRETAVWVWDGRWWPAVVSNAIADRDEGFLLVRFEHGVTAPARPTDLQPRDPDLRGVDKPLGPRPI
jgi:hypothetical protein